jgi:hypothetical protein
MHMYVFSDAVHRLGHDHSRAAVPSVPTSRSRVTLTHVTPKLINRTVSRVFVIAPRDFLSGSEILPT